jgi:hypothetical protein
MGSSYPSGERRVFFPEFNWNPDASGFLGYYSLNGLDPYMKRFEVALDMPEGGYWFLAERNRLKVYSEDVKLGEKKMSSLRRVKGKTITVEIWHGMKRNQYTYKWEEENL